MGWLSAFNPYDTGQQKKSWVLIEKTVPLVHQKYLNGSFPVHCPGFLPLAIVYKLLSNTRGELEDLQVATILSFLQHNGTLSVNVNIVHVLNFKAIQ